MEQTTPWIAVASVRDIPPGSVVRISHEGEDIAVFNVDGEFYAIGDTCTHAQQSLSEGEFFEDIHGWAVECPLHGSLFDLATGDAISLPATGNAGLFATLVEGGVLYLNPYPIVPFHT
ncbi:MAG: non-heme iron oxygenase ferredoxin subunit [Chloroflexota bacterium]|nr:non-heme iron oxygenase ferredoxin subunit [Chloroflexota bacterium]